MFSIFGKLHACSFSIKVNRIGVVTKVSDEIVHCVGFPLKGKLLFFKDNRLLDGLKKTSFYFFPFVCFLLGIFSLLILHALGLPVDYYNWAQLYYMQLFSWCFLYLVLFVPFWEYIKKLPDTFLLFFYRLYVLEENPLWVYIILGFSISLNYLVWIVIFYYWFIILLSIFLDTLIFFNILTFKIITLFISSNNLPLLGTLIELAKNGAVKLSLTKAVMKPAQKIIYTGLFLLTMEHCSCSTLGQTIVQHGDHVYTRWANGHNLPFEPITNPNKQSLLEAIIKK